MLKYLIISLVFFIFLEISGQFILNKIGNTNYFLAMPIGLLSLMAYCYVTTSILTSSNCSFWLILVIYVLYFVIIITLILKNIKKVKYKFNILDFVILIVIVGILLYYFCKTTLGDLNAYDTTAYLNMVANNIKATRLNSIHPMYGGYTDHLQSQYTSQSYYYFASVISYLVTKVASIFCKLDYVTNFVWIFQIIYFCFFGSLLINSIKRVKEKNYILKIFILVIYIFFYGKLYYNNAFGFYGNTYRTIAIAYSIIALYDLFKEQSKGNWFLLGVALLGSCAFSSTSLFEIIFIVFGSYFILIDRENNYFKYISLILFFPIINLLSVLTYQNVFISIAESLIICAILFALNDTLINISRKKYAKITILFIVTALMFVMSYKVTNNIFDFSAFNNNQSERFDMTIDYTKVTVSWWDMKKWYCVISVFLLGFSIIFNHKNDLIKFFLILIIAIFNPFCCSYLNSINMVYYRAYEIILNPFTITMMAEMFVSFKNFQYVNKIIVLIVLFLFVRLVNFSSPSYWHTSFVPTEDYNQLYKMTNDEYAVINFIKEDAEYREYDEPYIVTTNLLTQSFISNGIYLYCREYLVRDSWNDAEIKIHDLFNGELVTEDLSDIDLASVLKESGIDYLVMDKKQEYYDGTTDLYNYFYRYVSECGYGYSVYENDNYVIFFFER